MDYYENDLTDPEVSLSGGIDAAFEQVRARFSVLLTELSATAQQAVHSSLAELHKYIEDLTLHEYVKR
jgi:hypothetical protein